MLFLGESVCWDELCERLFEIFSDPLSRQIFALDIRPPEQLPNHQNVRKHVNPGTTEEEIKDRLHKSIFDVTYKDGQKLHRIITQIHSELVKSDSPAEQFTDKKKNLCSSTSCSSPECVLTAMCITNKVIEMEHLMVFGTRNSSKKNTREKAIYGHRHGTTITSPIKQRLTEHSNSGYSKKAEQESNQDTSRGAWKAAFDYFTQQLKVERIRRGDRREETSSTQESEYSQQDWCEEKEWQKEDNEFDSEEERRKSDSRCDTEEKDKEKLDGGGNRSRQEEEKRRNYKSHCGAEPEGNVDKPNQKHCRVSEDMQ